MNESEEELLELPAQLWVDWHGTGQRPAPERLRAVGDRRKRRPSGGIWTSSLLPDGSSAYVERMREVLGWVSPTVSRPAWLLRPRPVRVFVAEDRLAEVDLAAFAPAVFTSGTELWPQMAARFDAVHMTEAGARCFWRQPIAGEPRAGIRQRLLAAFDADDYGGPLDWWETESTLWLRWTFSAVEPLGEIEVPMMPNPAGQLPDH